MASEQFSLSWDNFHKNMSSGMHALLENEDLVDVTLAMEGQYLKAHKMVLSVCSPYFRQLFNMNPCKHPIVFMKDVSYAVMNDLLTFMYQGEVQVNQEHLATFIKTAEALQIKGLTGDNNESDDVIETASQKSQKRALNQETVKMRRTHSPSSKKAKLINASVARPAASPIQALPPPLSSITPKPKIERVTPTPVAQAPDIEFKIESEYEAAEDAASEQYDDIGDDGAFGDDTLDENQTEEDYSMMEGEEEPQAGTSGDAVNESQGTEESGTPCALPEKSRLQYELSYSRYETWCRERNENDITSEKVLLQYFEHLSKSLKASTLWATYSMLRAVICTKNNLNISKFPKVLSFLQTKLVGYKPKKSKILTREDIGEFLRVAHDDRYLMMKVVLIVGLCGACKCEELTNLRTENVMDFGQFIKIIIPKSLTSAKKIPREFYVTPGDILGVDMLRLVRKYIQLRPVDLECPRFFINYRNGKCNRQPVGVNTFGSLPRTIATFLQLPNSEEYTGHCFKRSSASLFPNHVPGLFVVNKNNVLSSNTIGEDPLYTGVEIKVEPDIEYREKI